MSSFGSGRGGWQRAFWLPLVLGIGIGVLVFGLRLGNAPLALAAVTLATAAAATALGLLLASVSTTVEQASGLATLLAIVLAALGGSMFPTTFMPPVMQALSRATPHAWALSGYQDVIVRGLGLQAVLPAAGMLLGFATLFFGFALWCFRFE